MLNINTLAGVAISAGIIFGAVSVRAQDVTTVVTDTTTAATAADAVVESPAASPLFATFRAVCDHGFVLSDAASAACTANAMPAPVRAGDRWPNRGIGAELNILARQLPVSVAAAE
jgi:hypothetical protein